MNDDSAICHWEEHQTNLDEICEKPEKIRIIWVIIVGIITIPLLILSVAYHWSEECVPHDTVYIRASPIGFAYFMIAAGFTGFCFGKVLKNWKIVIPIVSIIAICTAIIGTNLGPELIEGDFTRYGAPLRIWINLFISIFITLLGSAVAMAKFHHD